MSFFTASKLSYIVDNKKILNNISFNIELGEWISVIGPNGAGKTTLLRCLANVLSSNGAITFDGQALGNISKKTFFQSVGVSFQNFDNSSPILVKDFIKYSFYPFENLISEDQQSDALEDIIYKLKIEQVVNQKLNSLSGGELQKVKLAAALVKNPKIVFLDEIYNHLDPKVQDEIENILTNAHQNGMTIFSITHDLNKVITKSCRVICLKDGEIKFNDRPDKLLDLKILNSIFEKKFKVIKDNEYNYII